MLVGVLGWSSGTGGPIVLPGRVRAAPPRLAAAGAAYADPMRAVNSALLRTPSFE